MPDDNRQCRPHRLVEVNGSRHIEPPTREQVPNGYLRPQHDTRGCHHDEPPYQSPVLRLLGVIEPRKLSFIRPKPGVVEKGSPRIGRVLWRGQKVGYQPATVSGDSSIDDVVQA